MPTPATVDAVKKLRKNGFLTFLATGRTKCYIPSGFGEHFDGYVTTNGAYAEVGGAVVLDDIFPAELLSALVASMDELGIFYAFENQDVCYRKNVYNKPFDDAITLFKIPHEIFVPITAPEHMRANKLFISYETFSAVKELSKRFEGRIQIMHHRSGKSCDLDKYGMNKSVGMKAVCSYLGVESSQVYAFGDGDNDREMLEFAGHGIAMGIHKPSLDSCAEFVTRTVKDEGIAYALKHYGLI